MTEQVFDWLRVHEGPLAYVVLGLAGLIEYVFPPFPGDAIAVFGVCLAFGAGYHWALVYLALVLGAVVGGQIMWGVGRSLGTRERRPAFLRGPRAKTALDAVQARFETHGALFLMGHRFIPALRAFVYVAAGMSGLSFWRVLVLGGISALAWNALLLGAGWVVAANWHALSELLSAYSTIVIVLVLVAVGVALWRRNASRKSG